MGERKDVVEPVVAYAKARGWKHYKFVSPGRKAVPDDIFTKKPRRIIFIEFKDDGEPATRLQLHVHKELREQGFEVFVVDYREQGYAIFDAV